MRGDAEAEVLGPTGGQARTTEQVQEEELPVAQIPHPDAGAIQEHVTPCSYSYLPLRVPLAVKPARAMPS